MLNRKTRKYLALQAFVDHGKEWNVLRLIKLSQDIPAQRISLYALIERGRYMRLINSLRNGEYENVLAVDLRHPIILNARGKIMDGHHRLAKAYLFGKRYILARKFDKTPEPNWC